MAKPYHPSDSSSNGPLKSQVVNHHFSLLVEMLFDNFSRMKERVEEGKGLVNGEGVTGEEEGYVMEVVERLVKNVNGCIVANCDRKHCSSSLILLDPGMPLLE